MPSFFSRISSFLLESKQIIPNVSHTMQGTRPQKRTVSKLELAQRQTTKQPVRSHPARKLTRKRSSRSFSKGTNPSFSTSTALSSKSNTQSLSTSCSSPFTIPLTPFATSATSQASLLKKKDVFSTPSPMTISHRSKQHQNHGNKKKFPLWTEGPIVTKLENDILQVFLNNPKKLNCMDHELGERVVELVSLLREDNTQNVHGVIITGNGRGFSSGGDLEFLKARSVDTHLNNLTAMIDFYNMFLSIRTIPVPVMAALNGPAVGGGAAFAALADFRIASSKATIGFAFTNLGLHSGMASSFYLPKMCLRPDMATHLLLSAEIIPASRALELGIVEEVVEYTGTSFEENNQMILARAMEKMKMYTRHQSPASVTILSGLRAEQDIGLPNAILREATSQALAFGGPDFKERLDLMINRSNKYSQRHHHK